MKNKILIIILGIILIIGCNVKSWPDNELEYLNQKEFTLTVELTLKELELARLDGKISDEEYYKRCHEIHEIEKEYWENK